MNRNDEGHWLERPEGSAPLFDSRRATQANKIRWDAHRQRAADAIIKKAQERFPDLGIETSEQAWGALLGVVYEKALDSKSASHTQVVAKALDALARPDPTAQVTDNRTLNVIVMRDFTGLAENIRALAQKFMDEGKPEVAGYITAQLDEDSPYPQMVSYPDSIRSWERS